MQIKCIYVVAYYSRWKSIRSTLTWYLQKIFIKLKLFCEEQTPLWKTWKLMIWGRKTFFMIKYNYKVASDLFKIQTIFSILFMSGKYLTTCLHLRRKCLRTKEVLYVIFYKLAWIWKKLERNLRRMLPFVTIW